MPELSLFDVEVERDAGIARSAETAGDVWAVQALDFLHRYLTAHASMFVDDLWDAGLPEPSSGRALGAVIQTAARNGWIEQATHDGMILARPSIRSHLSLKPVWRSCIHAG